MKYSPFCTVFSFTALCSSSITNYTNLGFNIWKSLANSQHSLCRRQAWGKCQSFLILKRDYVAALLTRQNQQQRQCGHQQLTLKQRQSGGLVTLETHCTNLASCYTSLRVDGKIQRGIAQPGYLEAVLKRKKEMNEGTCYECEWKTS